MVSDPMWMGGALSLHGNSAYTLPSRKALDCLPVGFSPAEMVKYTVSRSQPKFYLPRRVVRK